MQADEFSIRIKYLVISLATVAALIFYASTFTEPVLRVSFLPDESPSFMRRKFKPLTDYLEKEIEMKIEFRPMSNGDALVEALVSNKLDMVWIDGANFIQAKARSSDQVIPLVQREEDAKTQSVFITAHHDITKLEDLKGRTISFASKTSASGHLMPRYYLLEAHIDPDTGMKRIFSGSADATVAAVASGDADAGALSSASWEKLIEQGKVDTKVVQVFYTTPGYHDYNWAVSANMDANLRLHLTDAFLKLDRNNGPDKEILDLQRATKFIPAKGEDYSIIEAAARSPGSSP